MTPAIPRLLVIDDDRTHTALLTRCLEGAGYNVHAAGDGQEGLDATRALSPEFVLCDWVMPRLNGIEYCRSVKSDPRLRDTFVTLLTTRAETADRVAGLDAGADDFLIKPVTLPELLARVRATLRVKALQRDRLAARHRTALIEMAATIGHEINNPLTALFGHLELMLQYVEQGDSERTRHHIRQAGEIATRVADVAQRMTALREPRFRNYCGDVAMVDIEAS